MATYPPKDADALSEAAMELVGCGIEIRLPWNCDLDDLEQSQFEGFANACRIYAASLRAELLTARADLQQAIAVRGKE